MEELCHDREKSRWPIRALFLDELPEFDRSVLEVLRQPLEDQQDDQPRCHVVDVSCVVHAGGCNESVSLWFLERPNARVSLLAVADPTLRWSHLRPLLDRIDIHIDVPAVKFRELAGADSI